MVSGKKKEQKELILESGIVNVCILDTCMRPWNHFLSGCCAVVRKHMMFCLVRIIATRSLSSGIRV